MGTVAAALLLVHALLSTLGFVGVYAAGDGDVTTTQAQKTIYRSGVFAAAVAGWIGAFRGFAGLGPAALVVAALLSLVVSGYITIVWRHDKGGYQLPALFAVLPTAVLLLVLA